VFRRTTPFLPEVEPVDQSDRAWPCPACQKRNNPECKHQYHSESAPSAAQGTPEPPKPPKHGDTATCRHCHRGIEFRANSGNVGWYHYSAEDHMYISLCNVKAEPIPALAGPQNGQGWVFTSSGELPESRTWVNVCTEHAGQRNVVPAYGVKLGNGWRWECEFEVIAWQPLPAPPTGDAPHKEKP
jgi:hypothetical protein